MSELPCNAAQKETTLFNKRTEGKNKKDNKGDKKKVVVKDNKNLSYMHDLDAMCIIDGFSSR